MKKPPIELERLRLYQDYGVDIGSRTISINSDIHEGSVDATLTSLDFLENSGDEPIKLIVSTFGGCEIGMLCLVDAIKASQCAVETVARGKCMSAGPLIVASGDIGCRYAYENCSWMIHVGTGELEGTYHQLKADMGWYKSIGDTWLDMMTDCSLMPRSHWKRLIDKNRDIFFTSEQALTWGLVDYVL